jgi:hypothetical protein
MELDREIARLPRSNSKLDSPKAKYPRLVRRWYNGRVQWCIQTKRIDSTRLYNRFSYYTDERWEERVLFDLVPLQDQRPHWSEAPPRSQSLFGRKPRRRKR